MSLLTKANILKGIIKSKFKSILLLPRIDLFLILALFVLVITPFIITMLFKIKTSNRQVNLYLSERLEELIGSEMTENLLNEFNGKNPDLNVRLLNSDDKSHNGKEPDIVIFDETDFYNLSKLAELNGYIYTEDHVHEQDADGCPCTLVSLTIPLVSFMDVLFYNIDILSQAGFDRPPKSSEEYASYSNTVTQAGFYCDELTPGNINGNRYLEAFIQGKAAMIIASTRAIPYLREKMGDDKFGLTVIPYTSDGLSGRFNLNLTGIDAGININCEKPDEAWSFIMFLAEQSALFCDKFKAIPGTVSDVIPGDYVNDALFYSKAWDIFEYNRR